MHKKESRDVLGEKMRKIFIDEHDIVKFGTLVRSEKTVANLANRWWPQAAKQEGDKTIHSKRFLV